MHYHFVSLFGRTPWGGCEELWAQTALHLLRTGQKVSAAVRWWPESSRHPLIRELAENGAELHFWGGRGTFYRSVGATLLNHVAKQLKRRRRFSGVHHPIVDADLVVFSSGGNEFPSAPIQACKRRGLPYVLVIHSVSESSWPRDEQRAELRPLYEAAEAAFFVSEANRTSTALQLGFESDTFRVAVNPYSVDWEQPFRWPARREFAEWAFVGRLEPAHKGVDLLLRAFARERWKERPLKLNFYGGGLSEKSVHEMAHMLRLDDRVVFHGQVGNIQKVWETNQLLVLPSRHEGLPLVIVEAMLCGRPCLVTNVSGNPELLEEGVTGFLAAGPAVDAVDAALERAWQNRGRFEAMGRAAYQSIRQRIPRDPIPLFAEQLHQIALRRPEAVNVPVPPAASPAVSSSSL